MLNNNWINNTLFRIIFEGLQMIKKLYKPVLDVSEVYYLHFIYIYYLHFKNIL